MTFQGRPAAAISVSAGSLNNAWDHILWHREIWPYEDDNSLNPLDARKVQTIAIGERGDAAQNDWDDGVGFVKLFRAPGGQTIMAWNESLENIAGMPVRVHKFAHFSTRELANLDNVVESLQADGWLGAISYRTFDRAIYRNSITDIGMLFEKYIGCP